MSIKCEICGKEFKTTQGLRGHKTFVHRMTNTEESPNGLTTEQRLCELENFVKRLTIETAKIIKTQKEFLKLVHKGTDMLSGIIDIISNLENRYTANN